MYYLIAFSLGIIISQFLPSLLNQVWLIALVIFAFVLLVAAYRFQRWRFTLAFVALVLLAFGYGQFSSGYQLAKKLPFELEQQEITLRVEVDSLPIDKGRFSQFRATVISGNQALAGQRILLNSYLKKPIAACDVLQLTVKLKRPHGQQNKGGFDYEAYLFEQGIVAKGYIRELIAREPREQKDSFCLNGLRERFKQALNSALPESSRWLSAIAIADKSQLSPSDKQLMKATGVGHLFVISGLHIGLVASVGFFLVMGLRRLGLGLLFYPRDFRPAAFIAAFVLALFYALLAGFSLPTQRALLMLWVFFAGSLIGVQSSLWLRYWLALAVLLLLKPQSVLNTGFILSFTALFYILLLQPLFYWAKTLRQKVLAFLLWQFFLSLLLLPVMYSYFAGWPLLSPIANIIAIPVVTFVVIPLMLLGLLLWLLGFGISLPLLLANQVLNSLISFLQWLNNSLAEFYLQQAIGPLAWCLLLLVSIIVLLKPRRITVVIAVCCLVLGLLVNEKPQLEKGAIQIDVIDVGQGLSVLVQTANHRLLYDLGAKWQTGSMAEMAVSPVLNHYLIDRLDALVISHHDNDHIGDVDWVLNHFRPKRLISAEPIAGFAADICKQGQSFVVDGFSFRFLNPLAQKANNRNDNSCVLQITGFKKTLLFAGDISAKQERKLRAVLPERIDLLIAPHHGSKYSSSKALTGRSENGIVVFSAGYKNRFNHPHPDVLQRFSEVQSLVFNTAEAGQITLLFSAQAEVEVEQFRRSYKRYWFD